MPTDPTPTPTPYPPDTGRTHYDGCWRERGHHNCAVARVDDLAAQLAAARAEIEKLKAAGQDNWLAAEFCKTLVKRLEDGW